MIAYASYYNPWAYKVKIKPGRNRPIMLSNIIILMWIRNRLLLMFLWWSHILDSTWLLLFLLSSPLLLIFGKEFLKTQPFLHLEGLSGALDAPIRLILAPVRSPLEPVRPVDLLSAFFFVSCPLSVKIFATAWGVSLCISFFHYYKNWLTATFFLALRRAQKITASVNAHH